MWKLVQNRYILTIQGLQTSMKALMKDVLQEEEEKWTCREVEWKKQLTIDFLKTRLWFFF